MTRVCPAQTERRWERGRTGRQARHARHTKARRKEKRARQGKTIFRTRLSSDREVKTQRQDEMACIGIRLIRGKEGQKRVKGVLHF